MVSAAKLMRLEGFRYEGNYLGEFGDGYFWDRSGNAVAFVEGASEGPALPVTEVVPMPPIPSTPPAQPAVPEVGEPEVGEPEVGEPEVGEPQERSGRWSEVGFEEYLAG